MKITVIKTQFCPYCEIATSIFRELKKSYDFEYEEIDANEAKGSFLVKKYGITSVPTIIIKNKDEKIFVGIINKAEIEKILKKS